jgi:hypothetical protein
MSWPVPRLALSIRLQSFLGKTVLLLLLFLSVVVVAVAAVSIFLVLMAVLLRSTSKKLPNVLEEFQFIPSAFARTGCKNAPVTSVMSACPSVLLSSCTNLRTTVNIFIKFGIGHINEICEEILCFDPTTNNYFCTKYSRSHYFYLF